jgi:Flp pilus assembly protein CpaB
MTAEYANDRRRRRLVILVGLILAIAATAGAYFVLGNRSTTQPTVTQRTVVVAAQDIPARTLITQPMVTTKQVPDSPVLASIASDPNQVIGKLALVAISAGAPIAADVYGTGTASGINILAPDETIGPDTPIWRAVSVTVPKDRAVGGKLSTGDHVDLFVTLSPQIYDPNGPAGGFSDPGHPAASTNVYYSDQTTKVTWTNVELLNADAENSLYTFKVDETQAEQIAHVQSIGASFTIGLRAPGDDRSFDPSTYGETTNTMIDLFGFPIPQQIVISSPGPASSAAPSASPEASASAAP